jgi:hypothetical protein
LGGLLVGDHAADENRLNTAIPMQPQWHGVFLLSMESHIFAIISTGGVAKFIRETTRGSNKYVELKSIGLETRAIAFFTLLLHNISGEDIALSSIWRLNSGRNS